MISCKLLLAYETVHRKLHHSLTVRQSDAVSEQKNSSEISTKFKFKKLHQNECAKVGKGGPLYPIDRQNDVSKSKRYVDVHNNGKIFTKEPQTFL